MKNDIEKIKLIIRTVARTFGVEPLDILGTSRKKHLAFARQFAMTLAYRGTNMSLTEVGACFGNRNHATVIHAMRVIDDHFDTSDMMRQVMDSIKRAQAESKRI